MPSAFFALFAIFAVKLGPGGDSLNYRRQLFYPAEIEVGLRCDEVRNRSFILSFGVFRKGMDELIH